MKSYLKQKLSVDLSAWYQNIREAVTNSLQVTISATQLLPFFPLYRCLITTAISNMQASVTTVKCTAKLKVGNSLFEALKGVASRLMPTYIVVLQAFLF